MAHSWLEPEAPADLLFVFYDFKSSISWHRRASLSWGLLVDSWDVLGASYSLGVNILRALFRF